MNSTKQLWSLFKFQLVSNPYIWIMAVALCIPIGLLPLLMDIPSYYPSLSSQLQPEATNLIVVVIFGMLLIGGERFQFGGQNTWNSGTEFLLTRAIDRPVLYRSKTVLLYSAVATVSLVSIVITLNRSDLTVTEYSKNVREQCLSHVPGSTLQPDPSGNTSPLIFIPQGKVLLGEWHFWLGLIAAAAIQAVVLALYPFKWRMPVFYCLLVAFVFGPSLWDLYSTVKETISPFQVLFFTFAAHQALFWVGTVGLIVLGQVWFERRFSNLEL